MSANTARRGGFTLVEVLVALVIMATMAVMAWRGMDGILRSRDISQASLLRSERLQTVLAQWEQDLRSLQDSGLTGVPPISFDGASLRLTRQQPQGMQVVVWGARSGRLYRWESQVLGTVSALEEAFVRSQQSLAQDGRELVVLEQVAGWQLYFYRGNAWSNAQSSDDFSGNAGPAKPTIAASAPGVPASAASAPPTAADSGSAAKRLLPSGVRMLIEFVPGGGFEGPLTRQVLLGPQS